MELWHVLAVVCVGPVGYVVQLKLQLSRYLVKLADAKELTRHSVILLTRLGVELRHAAYLVGIHPGYSKKLRWLLQLSALRTKTNKRHTTLQH